MATGFHGFHVLIGTIFLIVCLLRLMAGGFTPKQHFGFEAAAWYWHFVDVVWLFLFAFIYVIFGWTAGQAARLSLNRRGSIRSCAGLLGRCPNCGEGRLFDGFSEGRRALRGLRLRPAPGRPGDGPAVFIILIGGGLVVFGALFIESPSTRRSGLLIWRCPWSLACRWG